MRLLVTRPKPDGTRTAARLRAEGHDVVVAPVLRTEAVAAAFGPEPFAALVITSGNAPRVLAQDAERSIDLSTNIVRQTEIESQADSDSRSEALAGHQWRAELAALPLFAVGARSAQAARQAGFSDVVSADGDVGDLVALLAGRFAGRGARLLYLAGEDRTGDLAGALAAHGITVETAVVYRTVAAGDFPAQLRAALAAGPLDGVLHYSRRSAQAFLTGAQVAGLLAPALAAVHFCLSAEVAAPLEAAGAVRVRIAARPDEAALAGLLSQA
jgi:uroporphyrinogen-III synthase